MKIGIVMTILLLPFIFTKQSIANIDSTSPITRKTIESMVETNGDKKRLATVFFSRPLSNALIHNWSKKYKMEVFAVSGSVSKGKYAFSGSFLNVGGYQGSLKEILDTYIKSEHNIAVDNFRKNALIQASNINLSAKERKRSF